MLITMKLKWEVSPAEWVCKDEQQYSREEYQKQVDVKLCNKKRASCRPWNICQQPENQTCWLVLHLLRRGLMVYGVLSVGSILKHVFLLNRPMLIVVSLCRSRNKPWNQLQKLKRSSSCSFSSPSTVSTLNTFELHTLTCQKSLRQSTEFYQSDKFRGFKLHFQSNSTPSWTLSKYLKINKCIKHEVPHFWIQHRLRHLPEFSSTSASMLVWWRLYNRTCWALPWHTSPHPVDLLLDVCYLGLISRDMDVRKKLATWTTNLAKVKYEHWSYCVFFKDQNNQHYISPSILQTTLPCN